MSAIVREAALAAGLLCAVAVAAGAAAQERVDIGQADKVVNVVEGRFQGEVTRIDAADRVFHDEVIATGEDSATEIAFADETTLSIGAQSQVTLDEFVYDPDRGVSEVAVDIAVGVVRFVAGEPRGSSYVFKTPSATIGIRGTIVEILVAADGSTTLRVIEGVATITAGGQSVNVTQGFQSTAPPGGPPSPPTAMQPTPTQVAEMRSDLASAQTGGAAGTQGAAQAAVGSFSVAGAGIGLGLAIGAVIITVTGDGAPGTPGTPGAPGTPGTPGTQ